MFFMQLQCITVTERRLQRHRSATWCTNFSAFHCFFLCHDYSDQNWADGDSCAIGSSLEQSSSSNATFKGSFNLESSMTFTCPGHCYYHQLSYMPLKSMSYLSRNSNLSLLLVIINVLIWMQDHHFLRKTIPRIVRNFAGDLRVGNMLMRATVVGLLVFLALAACS